jgi:hypothetical protein
VLACSLAFEWGLSPHTAGTISLRCALDRCSGMRGLPDGAIPPSEEMAGSPKATTGR